MPERALCVEAAERMKDEVGVSCEWMSLVGFDGSDAGRRAWARLIRQLGKAKRADLDLRSCSVAPSD